MKRQLTFVAKGKLAVSLGIADERVTELDKFINAMIVQNASLQDIIVALNERGDLTDAEWTSTMYTLGWSTCLINGGVEN